jgi:hypothetical protein
MLLYIENKKLNKTKQRFEITSYYHNLHTQMSFTKVNLEIASCFHALLYVFHDKFNI